MPSEELRGDNIEGASSDSGESEVFGSDIRESDGVEVSEMTTQDRERVGKIIDDLDNFHIGADPDERRELIEELRSYGRGAVDYILSRVSDSANMRARRSLREIHLLADLATWDDADKIGWLLISPNMISNPDRSRRCAILSILEKIGTSENARHIKEFIAQIHETPPYGLLGPGTDRSNFFLSIDCNDAVRVLEAIYARTGDGHEREKIINAIDSVEFFRPLERGSASRGSSASNQDNSWVHAPAEYEDFGYENIDDDYDDESIEDDYEEAEFLNIENRLDVLRNLRHDIEIEKGINEPPEDDEAKFMRRHWLEYREENPSPYAPTLGIEIEIRESTVMTKEINSLPRDERMSVYDMKKEKYKATERSGVPAGRDKFWEFAHSPVKGYVTLSREVQALIEMGLINKDYRRHPLHLTIGGITSERRSGGEVMDEVYDMRRNDVSEDEQGRYYRNEVADRDAFILARALEGTGWSTTGGRLLRPYLSGRGAWNVKGMGGVNERYKEDIQLGMDKAVELRTFQLQSIAGLDRLLRSAYLLGAGLRAHQDIAYGNPMREGMDEETRSELSDIWCDFRSKCSGVIGKYGLNSEVWQWQEPHDYHTAQEREVNDFVPFAELLNESKKDPKSEGAKFVHEMRGLVISANSKIAKIVYQNPEEGDE